jgi:hypothetical protein
MLEKLEWEGAFAVSRYLLASLAATLASFALQGKSRVLATLSAFLMFALWGGSELVA